VRERKRKRGGGERETCARTEELTSRWQCQLDCDCRNYLLYCTMCSLLVTTPSSYNQISRSVDEDKLADAPVLKRAFTDRISLAAAVIQSMKPNVNKALGPYCTFDPVTGIGMAGDWFVEVHMNAKMSGCGTGLTPTSMRADLHMKTQQMHHRS
jgi:hypothetical protein